MPLDNRLQGVLTLIYSPLAHVDTPQVLDVLMPIFLDQQDRADYIAHVTGLCSCYSPVPERCNVVWTTERNP